ncbi:MAG: hypothetical protein L0H70_07320, partial [Xanthomonadales bacterium]|nr:hypothetical protein [Xanthomonadales bacterium]
MTVGDARAAGKVGPSASPDLDHGRDAHTPSEDSELGEQVVDRVLAAWDAARALLMAVRGLLVALTDLARSELHLAKASVPWVIGF